MNEIIDLDSGSEAEQNSNFNTELSNQKTHGFVDLSSDEENFVLADNTDDELLEVQNKSKQEIVLTDESENEENEKAKTESKETSIIDLENDVEGNNNNNNNNDDDGDDGDDHKPVLSQEEKQPSSQTEEANQNVIESINETLTEKTNKTLTQDKKPVDETIKNIDDEKLSIDKKDKELTLQQMLRKKMAEAAEKRLKFNISENLYDDLKESEPPTKKQKVESKTNVVLNSKTLPNSILNDKASRIRMISNPSYCSEFAVDGDKDTVSLYDMVGSKDLLKTYQFNMLIDFEYLTKFVSCKDCEFILVNKSDPEFLSIKDSSWDKWKISTIDVTNKLPKYGTHHTKMMVNFYRGNTCRIIVHTMNITEADHILQTQMCWMSPELKMQTNSSQWLDFNQPDISLTENTGVAFKRDFIAYLMTYDNPGINKLIDQVAKFDFSPIDVVFIASSPGHYLYSGWNELIKPTAKPMFGYGRLWQIIHMLKLESLCGKLVGQVSTIAGPCDSYQRNILLHLLTSCVEKGFPLMKKANFQFGSSNHVDPMIVWPTMDDVLKSKGSALSGFALHFTTKGQWEAYERQYSIVKNYLYKWSNFVDNPKQSKAGRSNLSAHVKTYVFTENNFKTLKWFLMTSANLSHQAWGKPNGFKDIEYNICSFEAGIFVDPNLLKIDSNTEKKRQILVPTYGRDTVEDESSLSNNVFKVGMRLPYDTPLTKYSTTDEPWSQPLSNQYFNN
ncbi:hypothetical protein C6P40_004715 [Pichia californica]|uniref:Tyrosyl-DNA phosphodiesterase n=1 Tax=Pichia californica TaxID=460514 RepID=A0A9P6WP81_9ASCO|nr:hypothetical protein C6P42_004720 [[Candida] californica]KAG0689638.1 hypothetical protein C6P40_004715 [[Candida] californica]